MATNSYLSNPVVKINAVDLTGFATAATVNVVYEGQDDTTFGQTERTNVKGLGNHTASVTCFMTYGAAEVYATLAPLVGTKTTLVVKPTSAADSATNPGFTLSNTYLGELPVISAELGSLSSVTLTFSGGQYTADVTP